MQASRRPRVTAADRWFWIVLRLTIANSSSSAELLTFLPSPLSLAERWIGSP
jgi:hypothetical protein